MCPNQHFVCHVATEPKVHSSVCRIIIIDQRNGQRRQRVAAVMALFVDQGLWSIIGTINSILPNYVPAFRLFGLRTLGQVHIGLINRDRDC